CAPRPGSAPSSGGARLVVQPLPVSSLVDRDRARSLTLGSRQTHGQHAVAIVRRNLRGIELRGQRQRPVELTGLTLAPMHAGLVLVRDGLLALDAQRVAADLHVEVLLAHAGQLRHYDEVLAVVEYADRGIR